VVRLLVACEFSGRVREAFRALGCDAWSCDIDKSADNSPYHIQDDVLNHLNDGWDMMIGFPPCTYLTVAGNRYYKDGDPKRVAAIEFFKALYNAPIPFIALENPVGVLSTKFRKPTQIIHPWQFGHSEKKRTCLWLKNLPKLVPTKIVDKGICEIERYSGFYDNAQKVRSLTYKGIAEAMADQWLKFVIQQLQSSNQEES